MYLIKDIRTFIKKQNLFIKGETVIIGVSGGADSVFLLRILNSIKHELGIQLIIAHFNHHLRKSSVRDENFVSDLAETLNIPLEIGHWNKKPSSKGSIEELARKARQRFFSRVAQKHKCKKIALAHTKNDLAETVLMRLLRGSGLSGLRGILPKRSINDLVYVRPIINISRKNIERFLKESKIKFITDPTNKETIYFRNKIRLKLIPELKKNYNDNIQDLLINISETACTDYDYLESQADAWFKRNAKHSKTKKEVQIPLDNFNRLHTAIKRMVIRLSILTVTGSINKITLKHINEIEDLISNRPVQSIVNLPKQLQARKLRSFLHLSCRSNQ